MNIVETVNNVGTYLSRLKEHIHEIENDLFPELKSSRIDEVRAEEIFAQMEISAETMINNTAEIKQVLKERV